MMNLNSVPNQQFPAMSTLLSQVATVIQVTSCALGMTRQDKSASAETEHAHIAKSGIAKVQVSRLAGSEDRIKEIRQQVTSARDCAVSNTTAWGERRLLANVNIERFLKQWNPIKAEFDRLVRRLEDDAEDIVERARANIGSFQIEVPTPEEIRGSFALEFTMEAIPDASKFQSNIMDKQIEAELKRRFEADISAAYTNAQQDAYQRLAVPLGRLVERMAAFDKREELKDKGIDTKEGYFRDSLVEGVIQMADVFESFNLTGDPTMTRIAKQLDDFRGLDAKALRAHADLRSETSKKAQAILDSLGDWIK